MRQHTPAASGANSIQEAMYHATDAAVAAAVAAAAAAIDLHWWRADWPCWLVKDIPAQVVNNQTSAQAQHAAEAEDGVHPL